jgi:nicotinic acid phosphoribosyltransferase
MAAGHAGKLIGTHAHELMMMTAQLLARYDDVAGGSNGPTCMSALLAHLLFLRTNGRLESATALADTFGTAAFVEVCAMPRPTSTTASALAG